MTAPDRPAPLRWLYVLIGLGLVSVGVAAGNLFFNGVSTFFVPYAVRLARCEAMHGQVAPSLTVGDFVTCMGDQSRLRGLVLAAAAALTVVTVLLLAFAIPLWDRVRLYRYDRLHLPAASQRFAELCRQHGLHGRRTPRLWVGGPAIRHAFTTALPGGRPTIVLPAGLALRPGAEFDAVVTHELAHVIARDVTWVSVIRGPLWLFIPIVAAASLPLLDRSGVGFAPATTLLEVTAMVAAVSLLALALLRHRELEADRYAAQSGAEPGLTALFTRAGARTRTRRPTAIARLLARHPDPDTRIGALRRARSGLEGGFTQALAVGFLAMLVLGAATTLLTTLNLRWQTWQGSAVPAAIGAAVLTTVVPSLFRRARADRPQWWRPLTGVAVGIAAGAFVSPAVSVTGQVPFPLVDGDIRARIAMVALLALLAAGAFALAIGLGTLVARLGGAGWRRIGVVMAGLTFVSVLWPITSVAVLVDTPERLRFWYTYLLVRSPWPAAGALLLAAYVVLLIVVRPRWTAGTWLVAAGGALAGAVAATLGVALTAPVELNDRLRVQQQGWWTCALAGLVVVVVVALVQRTPTAWAEAVVAGAATTAAATAARAAYLALAGEPPEPDASTVDVLAPMVWLFYLVLLLAPVLVPWSGAGTGLVRSPRRLLAPFGTVAATAAVAVLVVGVGVPGGFALQTTRTPADPYRAAYRPLDEGEARLLAAIAALVVPNNWSIVEAGPVGGLFSSGATIAPPACQPLNAESYLFTPAPRASANAEFSNQGSGDLAFTQATVSVYSYDQPVAAAMFEAMERARLDCPAFQLVGTSVTIDFAVRPASAPPIGERSWRYDTTLHSLLGPRSVTGDNAYVAVAAGHTVIVCYMSAVEQPLDEVTLQRILNNALHTLLNPR